LNARVKKPVLFWGAIVAFIVIAINCVGHLFGGERHFAGGPSGGFRQGGMMGQHGGMMGPQSGGGFGRHAMMMNGPHHGGGFHIFGSLLFLIIIIAIVILVVKWLRRKAKASSMNQFIDTPFVSSYTPVSRTNGSLLDQWEKSVTEKKENEENGTL
jgi:uncharacterized membrane protein